MINNNAAVELVHVVNPSGGSGEGYTAGAGITISDQNEIGIDQSVVATKAYVTQEIGTVREVPEASSADSGKVLGVTDSEGTLGWVANGGGASYTAGTGIDITNNEISVDTSVIATQNDISGLQPTLTAGDNISISNNTISATDTTYTAGTGLSLTGTEFAVDTTVIATQNDLPSSDELLPSATSSDEGKVLTIDSQGEAGWTIPASVDEVPAVTSTDDGKVLKATYSGGVGSYAWATESGGGSPSDSVFRAVYGSSTYAEVRAAFTAGKAICLVSGDEDDGVIASDVTFADEEDKIIFSRSNALNTSNNIRVDYTLARNGTWSTTSVTPRQVPSSTSADETKVLTVNASGNPVWATPSGGTTYTAGNMISLANDAVAVSTTAGITDIQLVNALPASPVATVLYLIPES